jgi:hypothetical protein
MYLWIVCIILILVLLFNFKRKEAFTNAQLVKYVKVINPYYTLNTTKERYLQISQLAVFDMSGMNVAVNRPVTASPSFKGSADPKSAVDGKLLNRGWKEIYHSAGQTGLEFWRVELAKPTLISRIEYYNRSDSCCKNFAMNYVLVLMGENDQSGNEVIIESMPFSSASNKITFYPSSQNGSVGPQGPKGEQGLKGDAGPQGLKGDRGAIGPAGSAGPAGKGEPGPRGLPGVAGTAGEIGPTGPMGPTGAGKDGIPGPAGPQGTPGPYGLQGPIGPTGPTGIQGLKGDQGPMGKDALVDGPSGFERTTLGSSAYNREV